MPALEHMRRRLLSAEKLHAVVRTLKVLAAANVRQYEHAVRSLGDFVDTIEAGLHIALRSPRAEPLHAHEPENGPLIAVVIGSDQGMCGTFNERIARHALTELKEVDANGGRRKLLVAGLRARLSLENAGEPADRLISLPNSIAGIKSCVQELVLAVDAWRMRGAADRVLLCYNEFANWGYHPHSVRLLPLDPIWMEQIRERPWPSRVRPIHMISWPRLFQSLVDQYLWVSIYRTLAESLAAENAARLHTMQAAEKNIEEYLSTLTVQFYRGRQDAITDELLDILSGSEAALVVPPEYSIRTGLEAADRT